MSEPTAIETRVINAKDGNFERHPESMTPRTFVVFMGGPKEPKYTWLCLPTTLNGSEATVYELLTSGEALLWPNLPAAKPGFDFWLITLKAGTPNDVSLVRNDPLSIPNGTIPNFQPSRPYVGDPLPSTIITSSRPEAMCQADGHAVSTVEDDSIPF